jgi:nicotinamide riboside kinase
MNLQKPFVITVIGPESSGKTTLASKLAEYFGCSWVPEYARGYLEKLGRDYDESDLEKIAAGQYSSILERMDISSPVLETDVFELRETSDKERELPVVKFYFEEFGSVPRPILIVDSGMLTLRLWARIKYARTIPLVEEAMKMDVTSLYILCRPVLPWEPDPLRESPALLDRAWIYNHYLQEMAKLRKK